MAPMVTPFVTKFFLNSEVIICSIPAMGITFFSHFDRVVRTLLAINGNDDKAKYFTSFL